MSNKRIYSADAAPVFQRWVPSVLDDSRPLPAVAPSVEPLLDYLGHQESPLPDGDDAANETATLEALCEQVRQQAYAEGLEEGRRQGAADADAVRAVLQSANTALQQLQTNLAPQVLDLALDFSRHILRSELLSKPEHIISLVQEMVQALPQPGAHPKLHLQQDDALLIREILGPELDALGWKIVPDHALQRGGCLIETHQGELNASLATRWQTLCNSLGLDRPLHDDPA